MAESQYLYGKIDSRNDELIIGENYWSIYLFVSLRGTAFRAHGGLPLRLESGARGTSRDCTPRNGSPSSRGLLRSLPYLCGRSTGKMVPFRGSRERICARTHARARRRHGGASRQPPSGGTLPVQWDLVPGRQEFLARSPDWTRKGDCL